MSCVLSRQIVYVRIINLTFRFFAEGFQNWQVSDFHVSDCYWLKLQKNHSFSICPLYIKRKLELTFNGQLIGSTLTTCSRLILRFVYKRRPYVLSLVKMLGISIPRKNSHYVVNRKLNFNMPTNVFLILMVNLLNGSRPLPFLIPL